MTNLICWILLVVLILSPFWIGHNFPESTYWD